MSEQAAVYRIGNISRMYPLHSLKRDGDAVPDYAGAVHRAHCHARTVVPLRHNNVQRSGGNNSPSDCHHSDSDQDAGSGQHILIEVTAYHEAGHALAAVYEGRHVTGVMVSMTAPGNGICRHDWLPPNPYDVTLSRGNALAAWEHTVKTTLADIRILLAGPLAEARLLGKPLRAMGSISDFDRCLLEANKLKTLGEFIDDITPVERIDPEKLLEEQRRKTRLWLARPKVWASIEMAAKVLALDGTLNAKQIGIIIASQSLKHNQIPFFFLEAPFKK